MNHDPLFEMGSPEVQTTEAFAIQLMDATICQGKFDACRSPVSDAVEAEEGLAD
jgi:hypothetical protein